MSEPPHYYFSHPQQQRHQQYQQQQYHQQQSYQQLSQSHFHQQSFNPQQQYLMMQQHQIIPQQQSIWCIMKIFGLSYECHILMPIRTKTSNEFGVHCYPWYCDFVSFQIIYHISETMIVGFK
jgi:hypothetical protein